MKFNERRLAYQANWEARERRLGKLYRRIIWVHRLSIAVLVLLLLAQSPIRFAIAIPILLVNLALVLHFRYISQKQMKYLEDSFQRFVEDELTRN